MQIINKDFKIPLYNGLFSVIFCYDELSIDEYYETHNRDFKIKYAHFFPVTSYQNNKQEKNEHILF